MRIVQRIVAAMVFAATLNGVAMAANTPPTPSRTIAIGENATHHNPAPNNSASAASNTVDTTVLPQRSPVPPVKPGTPDAERFYEDVYHRAKNNPESSVAAMKQVKDGQVSLIVITRNTNKPIAMLSYSDAANSVMFDTTVLTAAYNSGVPIIIITPGFGLSMDQLSSAFSLFDQGAITLMVVLVVFMLMRRLGASRSMKIDGEKATVRFSDVAGLEEAKAELQEIVDFLKNPQHYTRLGAEIPCGLLLKGPPGTGKTLLARAIAGEANVPFYALNSSDVIDSFISVAAQRVAKTFARARRKPADSALLRLVRKTSKLAQRTGGIIFIDEIDLITQHRGNGAGTDLQKEREHILTQLLVELDGVKHPKDPNHPIILIGATNRAHTMDPAILRPGRIDRQIEVPNPCSKERHEIFKIHTRNKSLNRDVDFDALAQMTPGMSGADIKNLCNEASLEAIRRDLAELTMACFEKSILRIVAGTPRNNLTISPGTKRIVAYHEAGHAVAAYLVEEADDPIWATMVPHGQALGLVMMAPAEDEYLVSRQRILARVKVAMAGRAAELEFFGLDQTTNGASSDRKSALKMLRDMIGELGLGKSARHVGFTPATGGFEHSLTLSEKSKTQFDDEVADEFSKVEVEVGELIRDNRDAVKRLAEAMLLRKTLNRQEIATLIRCDPAEMLTTDTLDVHVDSMDSAPELVLAINPLVDSTSQDG
jgi:cell division protease FtsH